MMMHLIFALKFDDKFYMTVVVLIKLVLIKAEGTYHKNNFCIFGHLLHVCETGNKGLI